METTPYFLCAPQASSGADAAAGCGARETGMVLVAPEGAVAPARMRRLPTGSGKQQQQQAGGSKKPPQRGLGVAELERLRCGGDPLRDLNAAVAAAAAMGDAALVQGHPVLHHHLPASAFDVATGARYISPLLVQPSPAPPAPPAPVCYVHSAPAGGQSAAPEKPQYFTDRWDRMGGFAPVPAANSLAGHHHHPQLPPLAPEFPSSQSTIWRPVSSSSSPSSCLHTGHRCDLCSRTMRAMTERGSRIPVAAAAAAATATLPDYSIYDLAAMASARPRKQENGDVFLALERKRKEAAAEEDEEVREIEFFPTSTTINTGGGSGHDHDQSELAAIALAPFSSSSGGGCTAPATLDLSLRL